MKWLCVPQSHCDTSLNVTPVVGTHSLFRAFLIRKALKEKEQILYLCIFLFLIIVRTVTFSWFGSKNRAKEQRIHGSRIDEGRKYCDVQVVDAHIQAQGCFGFLEMGDDTTEMRKRKLHHP